MPKLLTEEVFKGFESIFNPDLVTHVRVTALPGFWRGSKEHGRQEDEIEQGHLLWLRRHIGEWKDKLMGSYYLKPLSAAVYVREETSSKVFHYDHAGEVFSVVLDAKLVLPGGIDWDQIGNADIKEVVGKAAGKYMAKTILGEYPPPFEINPPLFSAGCQDTLYAYIMAQPRTEFDHIKNEDEAWGQRPEIVSIFHNDSFGQTVDSFVQRYDAKQVDKKLPDSQFKKLAMVNIKWGHDATQDDRVGLCRALTDYYRCWNIGFTIATHPDPEYTRQ